MQVAAAGKGGADDSFMQEFTISAETRRYLKRLEAGASVSPHADVADTHAHVADTHAHVADTLAHVADTHAHVADTCAPSGLLTLHKLAMVASSLWLHSPEPWMQSHIQAKMTEKGSDLGE